MKTKTTNQKSNLNKIIFVLIVTLSFLSESMSAQNQDSTQVLFKSTVKFSELWAPEIKINEIQGDFGTLIGFYGGVMIDRNFLVGISGGVNLGHPRVNYGYFGAIVQYIHKPERMVHFSGQLLVGTGTTKDYENPKSSLFDNFWNITGASFYLMEPGVNLELNLNAKLTLVAGMSYRYVSGLNESDANISYTHVTNRDLSGLNFNIGMKFNSFKKDKH